MQNDFILNRKALCSWIVNFIAQCCQSGEVGLFSGWLCRVNPQTNHKNSIITEQGGMYGSNCRHHPNRGSPRPEAHQLRADWTGPNGIRPEEMISHWSVGFTVGRAIGVPPTNSWPKLPLVGFWACAATGWRRVTDASLRIWGSRSSSLPVASTAAAEKPTAPCSALLPECFPSSVRRRIRRKGERMMMRFSWKVLNSFFGL